MSCLSSEFKTGPVGTIWDNVCAMYFSYFVFLILSQQRNASLPPPHNETPQEDVNTPYRDITKNQALLDYFSFAACSVSAMGLLSCVLEISVVAPPICSVTAPLVISSMQFRHYYSTRVMMFEMPSSEFLCRFS